MLNGGTSLKKPWPDRPLRVDSDGIDDVLRSWLTELDIAAFPSLATLGRLAITVVPVESD